MTPEEIKRNFLQVLEENKDLPPRVARRMARIKLGSMLRDEGYKNHNAVFEIHQFESTLPRLNNYR